MGASRAERAVGLALGLCLAGIASAADTPTGRRGPLESREEWLPAQPRLTLPAVSPDPLGRGETRFALELDWGNDFGLVERARAPGGIGMLVDGEHRTTVLDVRRGVTSSLTLGLRVPVRWRGPGVMDGIIDGWHRFTGLPDNRRSHFPNDRLRVEGLDDRLGPLAWQGSSGAGLGDVELLTHWAFRRPARTGWAAAVIGRATLPTGSGTFRAAGVDAGAQLVAARPLGRSTDVYLGLGGTLLGDATRDGLHYERRRGHGFVALEWRPGPRLSLLLEASASSRLLAGIPDSTGRPVYVKAGVKRDVHRGWRVQLGIVEGVLAIQSATDFGVLFGLSRTSRGRGHDP